MFTITPAENGYIITAAMADGEYYLVAIDIDDACATVKMLLEEESHLNADLSSIAFDKVPNG